MLCLCYLLSLILLYLFYLPHGIALVCIAYSALTTLFVSLFPIYVRTLVLLSVDTAQKRASSIICRYSTTDLKYDDTHVFMSIMKKD